MSPGVVDNFGYQLKLVCGSRGVKFRVASFFRLRAFPFFPPRRLLQVRQMTRTFSSASFPPCECGMMWSTSGEFGALCVL